MLVVSNWQHQLPFHLQIPPRPSHQPLQPLCSLTMHKLQSPNNPLSPSLSSIVKIKIYPPQYPHSSSDSSSESPSSLTSSLNLARLVAQTATCRFVSFSMIPLGFTGKQRRTCRRVVMWAAKVVGIWGGGSMRMDGAVG